MKVNKKRVMLKRKKDGQEKMKVYKERVMLKRKKDSRERKQRSEVVDKKDSAVMVDDKKIRVETHILSNETPSQAIRASSPVIFILENASLKKGIVRKKPKILNSEEDSDFLLRQGKKLNDYRPDIIYEVLKEILDSPPNKRGMWNYWRSLVFVPKIREILMRVLKEPISHHLPKHANIIGLSYNSPKLIDIENYVASVADDVSPVFVVGTMVHGEIGKDNCEDYISVSNYPLSARYCAGVVCCSLEQKWKKAAFDL